MLVTGVSGYFRSACVCDLPFDFQPRPLCLGSLTSRRGVFKEAFRKPKPDDKHQVFLHLREVGMKIEHQLIREVFLELGSLAGMVCYFSFQACPSIGIHSNPNRKRDPCHAGPVLQRAFLGLKDRHCHGWIWIWTSSQWLS